MTLGFVGGKCSLRTYLYEGEQIQLDELAHQGGVPLRNMLMGIKSLSCLNELTFLLVAKEIEDCWYQFLSAC